MLADSSKDASGVESAAQLHAESEHSLRATRELRQLTVDDVANVLHLSREHILALEAGDFARLGPPVFVRGYLRSYARLLELPEQSLLAGFPVTDLEPEEFRTMSLPAELKPGFDLRGWMVWLLLGIALLIAILAFFISTLDTDSDQVAAENDVAAVKSVTTIRGSTTAKKVILSNDGKPQFTVVEPGLKSTGSSALFVPAANTDSAADSDSAADGLPGSLPVDDQAEATVPPEQPMPVAAEVQPVTVPAAGAVALTLTFTDECWVEITDSRRSLLYGLEKPGAVVNLEGVPPFKLFFGNREAVRIALAGKPFVIPASAPDAGNTARFTIKEEQL